MIITKNGQSNSLRTDKEELELLERDLKSLKPDERETLQILIDELKGEEQGLLAPDGGLFRQMSALEYKTTPVDMKTFIYDKYFLGNSSDTLYPQWSEALTELFEGGYQECIFGGGIGIGKCTHLTTSYVSDTTTGERRCLRDWIGKQPDVPSLQADGSIAPSRSSQIWDSGTKECLKLELASGQWLEASLDHPVLTPSGWKQLQELKVDDFVAAARSTPAPSVPLNVTDEEAILMGLYLADGCGLEFGHTVYCKGNLELVDIFEKCVSTIEGFSGFGNKEEKFGAWYVRPHGMLSWIRRWGLDEGSKAKRIPGRLFGLSNRHVALLLRALWTDGYVGAKTAQPRLELVLASESLIDDVQELLHRFGIIARKCFKLASIKNKETGEVKVYDAWKLYITDSDQLRLFLDKIGPVFGYEKECAELSARLVDRVANTNFDVVPITTQELKEIRKEVGGIPKKEWEQYCLLQTGSYMGRKKFQRLVEHFKYTGKYVRFATMDVVWERVKSLTPIGPKGVGDLTVPGTANAVVNGIIIHNTFAASVGIARVLYELSCMVNPHRSFGLGLDSNISIVAFSVTEMLATKVVFENVVTKIDSSPYFRENFPFEKTKKELRFPNRIWVAARATTDSSALGLNVISALLDEANFLPKPSASKANDPQFAGADRAETIYNAIKRRMKSRFEKFGKLPGILFIMSSKTTADDFVSRRINESKYDSSIFVREFSVWAAKKDKGYYESETFPVLAGNEQVPSRILEPGEAEKIRATLPEGCVITDVPIDFKPDFVTDLEKAIRDIAGIATLAISPFIQQREKILSAVDTTRKHPFSTLVYDATKGGMFRWDMMVEQKSVRQYGQRMEKVLPIINPLAPRHIHVDPSFRRDSLGFCMAHIGGWRDVIRRNPETQEKFKERAPIYMVDFLLRVVPPTGSEIILGDIRRLIYELTAHGYLITMVSMDTFQSVDSIQQLAQKGYNSRDISVDTTPEPYDSLKTALYEDRVNYYEYTPLLEELRSLEQRWDSRKKRKIDHPPRGGKDVADALSGCLWTLSQNAPSSQPLAPLRSESRVSSDDAWMEEQRQAELAGQRRASHTTPLLDDFGMLMPFLPPEKDPDPWGSGGGGGFGGGWP